MDLLRDADIDPAPLVGKRVAIIGFGNQGRAQALNLKDSGVDVVVGLRPGSGSAAEVERAGIAHLPPAEAAAGADLDNAARARRNARLRFTRNWSRIFATARRSASATVWRSASG